MNYELIFDNNVNIQITDDSIINCLKIFIDQSHPVGYYNENDLLNIIVKDISDTITLNKQCCYLFNVSNEKIACSCDDQSIGTLLNETLLITMDYNFNIHMYYNGHKLRLTTLGIELIQDALIDAEYYSYLTKQEGR